MPAVVGEHDENEENAQAGKRAVGTGKQSIETKSRTWLARNVRHV
jgi:hypothetical protein